MMGRINTVLGLIIIILVLFSACKETDDVGPILTLNGYDSLVHVLNTAYVDQGAKATDETDGTITENIFVDNQVNEDLIGYFNVTYSVVDQAGNEALPLVRAVEVYNQARIYTDYYYATEDQLPPNTGSCDYTTYVRVDSTLNNRIEFKYFACDSALVVYADILDSIIVIPFQIITDSTQNMSFQGSGTINDSIIEIEYRRKTDTVSTYWNSTFIRL